MPTVNHPVVGRVQFEILDGRGGPIRLLGDFESSNIISVSVPELRGIPLFETDGEPFSGNVRFHKNGAEQLQAAWKEVKRRGLMDRVLTWDGSFNSRLIRGSATKPSDHAFGTAFDINAGFNGLGVFPPPAGRRGSVRDLVPIFESHGFRWGGNFTRLDGMHFEIARFGMEPLAPAHPSVQVFLNNEQVVVPALLIENQTFIGVRALVKEIGGSIPSVENNPFSVTVSANRSKKLAGLNIDGIGYVVFRDVIELYNGVQFDFDSTRKRLDIIKPAS